MADWKSLTDPKLKADFEKAGADPRAAEKARAKFIKSLETAKSQFGSLTPTKGAKAWRVNNQVVQFAPRVGRQEVAIGGASTHYIPAERFEAFLNALIESTKAGELDEEIQAPVAKSVVRDAKPDGRSTRVLSPESKLNIRVGGFRRGGKSDADITKQLKSEGLDDATIKKALARKAAAK